MDQFIAKHADKIEGTLSCFDRVLFRGYLPFFSGAAMAAQGRPFQYFGERVRRKSLPVRSPSETGFRKGSCVC